MGGLFLLKREFFLSTVSKCLFIKYCLINGGLKTGLLPSNLKAPSQFCHTLQCNTNNKSNNTTNKALSD